MMLPVRKKFILIDATDKRELYSSNADISDN